MWTDIRLSFLLAWRFLWSANREPAVASMVRICFFGILLGSCALALVGAIMQGFETATRMQLQSVHPEMMIRAGVHEMNYEKVRAALVREFPQIIAYAPVLQHFVMVKDDGASDTVVQLMGIDPQAESRVTQLERMIVGAPASFAQILTGNGVIVGKKLATNSGLAYGDTFRLLYIGTQDRVHEVAVTVRGFIRTGIDEYDTGLVLASYDFVHELFPEQSVSQVGLKLAPGASENDILRALRARMPFDIVTWYDLYPALLAALTLEKYAMFFIIMLISLVASMNIISLIFMLITQKRAIIALLRACGCSLTIIKMTFMLIGLFIGVCATVFGLACAWLIGLFLQHTSLISLPDVYYTSHLPIVLHPLLFVLVLIVVIVMALGATVIPIRRISAIVIADVLRFEG